ncbi:hypothetical protein A5N68_03380 [Prescottella equi]|uniref:Uncharacterized protein n=1 Tax=Rhodococcus hoagii TaxID=43767 RepID=A0AAE5MKU9_RHOHA|nr:hypothetical protein A5N68_03380 [Prescottella equi]
MPLLLLEAPRVADSRFAPASPGVRLLLPEVGEQVVGDRPRDAPVALVDRESGIGGEVADQYEQAAERQL